jgi:anthranilate phosphoribosyltransferase
VKATLEILLAGRDLSFEEARGAMDGVMAGEATPAQIAAFLVALRAKGETVDEIAGCASAMREHVVATRPRRNDLVEAVGTGGDRAGTFNISTTGALVAAAAGAAVAKHGNRAITSKCGAADVLEALGIVIELPHEAVAELIDEVGFGFLFAPSHHPAMRHAGPVRRELGVPTVMNLLGPLTNPVGVRRAVIGVSRPELVETFAHVLARLGAERAMVVHGSGLDELTAAGPCHVAYVADGVVIEIDIIDPAALGLAPCTVESLAGGDPAENARIVHAILAGEGGPRRDAVLLTAAAALTVGGHVDTIEDGLQRAAAAVDSGAAATLVERLGVRTTELSGRIP